jgi:hypothetical protein
VALRRWIYSDSLTHVSKGRVFFLFYWRTLCLLQVKVITIVKSPEGTTTYRMTERINCSTRQFAIIDYWSTGTSAAQQSQMADGKWKSIADYDNMPSLAKKICPKK